jgi:hypothetical protein
MDRHVSVLVAPLVMFYHQRQRDDGLRAGVSEEVNLYGVRNIIIAFVGVSEFIQGSQIGEGCYRHVMIVMRGTSHRRYPRG